MQSDEEHQEQDQNQHHYQQPDPLKEVWKGLQDFDKPRWSVREETQKEFDKDHGLCLVAKGSIHIIKIRRASRWPFLELGSWEGK